MIYCYEKISHCERYKWYCLWHKPNPDKVSRHNIIHCYMSYNHLSVHGNTEKGEGLSNRWWNFTWLSLLGEVIPLCPAQHISVNTQLLCFNIRYLGNSLYCELLSFGEQDIFTKIVLVSLFTWSGVVALGTNVIGIMTDFSEMGEWKSIQPNLLF